MRIRVAVVDDDPFVRAALRGYLATDDVEFVGETDDGLTAADLIARTRPDVVLMDVRMTKQDGLTTITALRADGIDVPIIVLTTFDDDEHLAAAFAAGAQGFLLKDTEPGLMIESIRTVHAGGTALSSEPARRLIAKKPRPAMADQFDLSDRDLEVLTELCRASSNAEIAAALCIAESTVKTRVSAVLDKLGATSRLKAVVRAFEFGLVDPPG